MDEDCRDLSGNQAFTWLCQPSSVACRSDTPRTEPRTTADQTARAAPDAVNKYVVDLLPEAVTARVQLNLYRGGHLGMHASACECKFSLSRTWASPDDWGTASGSRRFRCINLMANELGIMLDGMGSAQKVTLDFIYRFTG